MEPQIPEPESHWVALELEVIDLAVMSDSLFFALAEPPTPWQKVL